MCESQAPTRDRPEEVEPVRRVWQSLGLPGIIDVHTHFMPARVMEKVWAYFDRVGPDMGQDWPITYRTSEARRVETLRQFGVRRFTAMIYPHKPQMAAWLNRWAEEFARSTPDCLATATFYPEPDAAQYVDAAIGNGARVFKAHLQVGDYDPNDSLLDQVWGAIEDAAVPVVIHCGSGPTPGTFTGPEPIWRLMHRYPTLPLIIAHMGMPEYTEFLDICEHFANVRLDTTMAFTQFTEEMTPFPSDQHRRLPRLGDRILFGSDFPNIPYRYLDALHAVTMLTGIDDDWLRKVLFRNAAQLFSVQA
jgi:predicted TIM-barrel fold metal-dependent hydrolase